MRGLRSGYQPVNVVVAVLAVSADWLCLGNHLVVNGWPSKAIGIGQEKLGKNLGNAFRTVGGESKARQKVETALRIDLLDHRGDKRRCNTVVAEIIHQLIRALRESVVKLG